ncbi:hypothetical protein D3C81_1282370 [compost metagenome]
MVHLALHDARHQHEHWIVRLAREGFGAFRHLQRQRIVAAQTEQIAESVQQATAHWMPGYIR